MVDAMKPTSNMEAVTFFALPWSAAHLSLFAFSFTSLSHFVIVIVIIIEFIQKTDPTATWSRELNFRIRRSSRIICRVTDSCQSKSTNLQKCPHVNKNCMFKNNYEYKYFKTVLGYKYKYQVCI